MSKRRLTAQAGEKPQIDRYWQVRAAAGQPKVGELLLYGVISTTKWYEDDVTPTQIRKDIEALGDLDELRVYINSPGGNVFASQAIHQILHRLDAEVVVFIDGIAASGATHVAMAADRIVMHSGSMMMIHKAWTFALGNADDLRKVAGVLDQVDRTQVAVYRDRTGLPDEEILSMMQEETWLTAEEAIEKGFADEVEETSTVAASLQGDALVVNGRTFDVSGFRTRPPVPEEPAPDRAPSTTQSGGATGGITINITGDVLSPDACAAAVAAALGQATPEKGGALSMRRRRLALAERET